MTGTVAATAAVAAPALAKAGTGAKQNWFGVIGADQELGGGMSNYFAESDTYSPYSPYSKGDNALYKTDDKAFMTKVKIDILKDSQKRLQSVPGFIEGRKWEEIRSLLTAKVRLCVPRLPVRALLGHPATAGIASYFGSVWNARKQPPPPLPNLKTRIHAPTRV